MAADVKICCGEAGSITLLLGSPADTTKVLWGRKKHTHTQAPLPPPSGSQVPVLVRVALSLCFWGRCGAIDSFCRVSHFFSNFRCFNSCLEPNLLCDLICTRLQLAQYSLGQYNITGRWQRLLPYYLQTRGSNSFFFWRHWDWASLLTVPSLCPTDFTIQVQQGHTAG